MKERLLGENFGAEYEAYRARIRRLGFGSPKKAKGPPSEEDGPSSI